MDGQGLQNNKRTQDRNHARNLCGQLQNSQNYKLLPSVIKLMAHSDIAVKRICYATYAKHSHKVPSEALLAVNTILHDSAHQSPLVRALVINTVSMTRAESTNGLYHKVITDGLQDTSALVRRHAVVALAKINSQQNTTDDNLAGPMLTDPDPLVLTLSVACEIGSNTGIEEKGTLTLLNRLNTCTPDGQVQILTRLLGYTPTDEAQLLDILNIVDSYLDSGHMSVRTATMDMFLHLSKQAESSLVGDMYKRVRSACLRTLQSDDITDVYCVLLWLQDALHRHGETTPNKQGGPSLIDTTMQDNFRLVLDKPSDTPYLSLLKMDMLKYFVKGDNLTIILDSLRCLIQARSSVTLICDKAIEVLSDLKKTYKEQCENVLKELLLTEDLRVCVSLLKYLHEISSYDSSECVKVFQVVLPHWRSLSNPQLMVLLNLCANFAHTDKDNLKHVYDISQFIHNSKPSVCYDLKCVLLACLYECFVAQPGEYRHLLWDCMTYFNEASDLLLKEQVKRYAQKIQNLIC